MPSPGAIERGIAAAEAILQQHRQEHDGAWPETVAVRSLCTCLQGLVLLARSVIAAMQQHHMCGPMQTGTATTCAGRTCTACSLWVPAPAHHLQPAVPESSSALQARLSRQLMFWSSMPVVRQNTDQHAPTHPCQLIPRQPVSPVAQAVAAAGQSVGPRCHKNKRGVRGHRAAPAGSAAPVRRHRQASQEDHIIPSSLAEVLYDHQGQMSVSLCMPASRTWAFCNVSGCHMNCCIV